MSTPSEELFRIEKELASLQKREAELLNQATRLTKQINNDYNAQLIKEQAEEQAKIDQHILNWITNHKDKFCKNGFVFQYDVNHTKTLIYGKNDSNEALISKQFNFTTFEQVDEILTNIEYIITLYQTVMSKPISDNEKDFKENLYIAHANYVQTEYNTKNGDTIHVTMQYDGSHVTLKVSYDSSEFYNKNITIIKLSDTTHVAIFSHGYNNHEVDLVDESTCSLNDISTAFATALDKLTYVAYNHIENMIE